MSLCGVLKPEMILRTGFLHAGHFVMLFEGKPVQQAILDLMTRDPKQERD